MTRKNGLALLRCFAWRRLEASYVWDGLMSAFNPHSIAGQLRDHLATHDRPLVFFFGAGTSASIKITSNNIEKPLIPAIAALTEVCKKAVSDLGEEYAAAWSNLCLECAASGLPENVENILSRIRIKINAMGDDDMSCGLSRGGLCDVEKTVAEKIADESNPDIDSIPDECPHDIFSRWVARTSRLSPIEIFTTNYDVLIERSLERARVPVFDGFIGSHKPLDYSWKLDFGEMR